nr:unnamed protein product [Spirometra erinaceieuropaei]
MLRPDRRLVEQLFSSRVIRVLVCTATLAWGVNLPAHAVVIKGTKIYDADKSDFVDLDILDVVQIFGRAGRPQFDTFGLATIITTRDKLDHYVRLITNQVAIESKLLSNINDHLNAEIALGTVTNIDEAVTWLSYTYLFVRLQRSPLNYGITPAMLQARYFCLILNLIVFEDPDFTHFMTSALRKAALELDKAEMVRYEESTGQLASTDRGRTASLYYIKYETAALVKDAMHPLMLIADLFALISQAEEFSSMKVRDEEENDLLDLQDNACHVPVKNPGTVDSNIKKKINVLLQAYISRQQPRTHSLISDMNYIQQNAGRLARYMFEIAVRRGWAVVASHAHRLSKTQIFHSLYHQDVNILLGSPTGSGKTVAAELAILRVFNTAPKKKCIYIAPLKALVRERVDDWSVKIGEKLGKSGVVGMVFIVAMVVLVVVAVGRHRLYHPRRNLRDDGDDDHSTHSYHRQPSNYPNLQPCGLCPDLSALRSSSRIILIGQIAFKGIERLNPIQSIVFDAAYNSSENLLICAPTGAGKTNTAMLTVVRLIREHLNEDFVLDLKAFKIVYMAPMKALAAEMTATFSKRLNPLGIKVRECTGDMQLSKQEIMDTQMLVTTPEKWDVISRKGAGDASLVQALKLLIIDEVHLLHEDRGAVIEALVARTLRQASLPLKYSLLVEVSQSMIRIVGLSATLPNYVDVAQFLRVNLNRGLFYFDSRFRPVPLGMSFLGVTPPNRHSQEEAMNEACYQKVIEQLRQDEQVMVFVHARGETSKTARWIRDTAVQRGDVAHFQPLAANTVDLFKRVSHLPHLVAVAVVFIVILHLYLAPRLL